MQVIYSGGMDVDILPKGASKGDGLKFLLREARSFFFFAYLFVREAKRCHTTFCLYRPADSRAR